MKLNYMELLMPASASLLLLTVYAQKSFTTFERDIVAKFRFIYQVGGKTESKLTSLPGPNETKTTQLSNVLPAYVKAKQEIVTNFSDRQSFLGELNTENLLYTKTLSEVTKFINDGENLLDELSLSQKRTQLYFPIIKSS
jgi:hypothetical protein